MDKKDFMALAIKEAKKGIIKGDGGPFGAVIVKDGEVIASAHNCVISASDPTCHGEIHAIRKACKKLNTFDLKGCEIYTTGYPCPMCECAIMWANIKKVFYGCDSADAKFIGFRDEKFDDEDADDKLLNCKQINRDECYEVFLDYKKMKDKIKY